MVLLLVAQGDFQRKGLAPLITALADARLASARLLVVGGTPSAMYRDQAEALRVQDRVTFCGRQGEHESVLPGGGCVCPPLKNMKFFPAVTIEAAASGLPLITTRLNGVEEYSVDSVTGFIIREVAAGCHSRRDREVSGPLRGRAPRDGLPRARSRSVFRPSMHLSKVLG